MIQVSPDLPSADNRFGFGSIQGCLFEVLRSFRSFLFGRDVLETGKVLQGSAVDGFFTGVDFVHSSVDQDDGSQVRTARVSADLVWDSPTKIDVVIKDEQDGLIVSEWSCSLGPTDPFTTSRDGAAGVGSQCRPMGPVLNRHRSQRTGLFGGGLTFSKDFFGVLEFFLDWFPGDLVGGGFLRIPLVKEVDCLLARGPSIFGG